MSNVQAAIPPALRSKYSRGAPTFPVHDEVKEQAMRTMKPWSVPESCTESCTCALSRFTPMIAWLTASLAAGLMLVSAGAGAVTYANTSTSFNWIDASTHTKLGPTTGGVYSPLYSFKNTGGCATTPPTIDDTLTDNIPIGFTFMYGGVNFTQVRIMSNGRLQFNNNTTCGFGSPVTQLPYPDAGMNYTMRIYGNDLDPTLKSEVAGYKTACTSRATCYVSYATLGTAPYRSFVVTWSNVPEWAVGGSTSGNYNLQVILQENGEFIYQYGANTPGPGNTTAQVGWQVDTSDYDVPSVGFPASNSAIKFFIPRPVAEYRMEQPSWNGTAGEVLDTSGNGQHGTAVGSAQTVPGGQVCRGADIPSNSNTNNISAIDSGISLPADVGGVGTITFWYKGNSAWSGGGVQDAQLLDATVVNNQWFFVVRRSNGRLRFVIRDSTGTDRIAETGAITVVANTWKHIAVSWNFNALAGSNQDHMRIYADGVLQTTLTFTTAGTVSAQIGALYIGDNRSSFTGLNGTGRSADGVIDEFRIYNYEGGLALVQRDMNQTGACLDHYAITISGTPSTCQPVQVTVTAHDVGHGQVIMPNNTTQITLSTSTGRGDWSLVSGYGAFSNGAADDGIATYLFNGEYQAVLNYQATIAGNVNFNVTDGQIVESDKDPTLSVGGCVSSFNGCEATLPQCAPTAPPALGYAALYTKLSGTAFDQEGVALKSDGMLEGGFSGSVAVDLLANINSGVALNPNNCPVSQNAIIPLGNKTFSAGRTSISGITVADAYRDVRMRFTCAPAVCSSAITVCSSDSFAVRPQAFTVTANLGGPTLAAGNNFTLTAASGVSAGYTGTPVLDTALVQDHNGAAAGALNGSFGAATGSSATDTFQYHDVGTISLLADAVTDSAYTIVDQSVDCVSGSTSNTLAGGKYGCNVGSVAAGPFGRFYPDHFTYAATLTPACAGGGFSYMDQPALGLSLTLTAQSTNGTTTARYTAGYAPLGAFAITGDNGGTPVSVSRLSPALPAFVWSSGVYTVAGTYAFTRNATPDGPYDSFALKASVTDPDGALITGATLSNLTKIRFGRLRLMNAYGSELIDLPVPVEAQYYNGTAFITNAQDNCTTLMTDNVKLTTGLSGITATLGGAFVNGKGSLKLSKPSPAAKGVVDICVDLDVGAGGDATCQATTPADKTYLQGKWSGANYDKDPVVRGTFGLYKSPNEIIFIRENY